MGRKLVDMSELEYSVVSTVVVAVLVYYTRLARVTRGRSLSIFVLTMGFCFFTSLLYKIILKAPYFDIFIPILCRFILFDTHINCVVSTPLG